MPAEVLEWRPWGGRNHPTQSAHSLARHPPWVVDTVTETAPGPRSTAMGREWARDTPILLLPADPVSGIVTAVPSLRPTLERVAQRPTAPHPSTAPALRGRDRP